MAQPIAPDYGQQFLFPPALEDWVPADHPARFLREFVDQLDLAALGFAIPWANEGRPPYAPSLLLKIWLYGYFHRIRATRKLEAACGDHLPLLWLTGLIAPDHNSLWRFWHENRKALRQVFKQSAQLALRAGAVGLVLQALDGTKIEAAASGYSGWSKEYMEKLLAALDATLDKTELALLEENQQGPGYRLPAGLAERQALREQIKTGLAQLAADGRNHYHPIEPEARRMKVGGTNRFAYRCHCRDCPVRAQCTRDPKGRQVEVWPHAATVQTMRARLQTPGGQAQYRQRSQIVERRFGQIKQHDGFRRWTVWGLESVRTQWSLLCATLNLRILYRRWRQGAPASPAATAIRAGERPKAGILPGLLFHLARKVQKVAGRALQPCRHLASWSAA